MAMASNCQAADRGRSRPEKASDAKNDRNPAIGATAAPSGCGECAACRKIQSGNHPDLHWLKPTGSIIKIGQIRELAARVILKPYEANYRVIIIVGAHKMNAAAANALLKLLEEPPARTLFILTAPQPGDLLPTVASRCQHIRFNPISRAQLQRRLRVAPGISESEIEVIAALAEGSSKRADALVQTNYLIRRNWLVDQMMNVSTKSINRLLALAEYLASNRTQLQDNLDIMQSWLRDLLVHFYDPGKMLNVDLAAMVPPAQAGWHPDAIIVKMKAIESARKCIEANTNPRLTCEALLIQIAG